MVRVLFVVSFGALLLGGGAAAQEDEAAAARAAMVEDIDRMAAEARGFGVPEQLDPAVLEVMRQVPRHLLVPEELRPQAYQNQPLPIGYGQTISQPYIVALMTDLLDLEPGETALEVGTGSGYQAAVLAPLTEHVYTIEIVEPLAMRAAGDLQALGLDDVTVRQGDGYYGWAEHAPFDAIVVTAAASHIPPPLVEQLKPGGRMVIPVGPPFMTQNLMLVEKDETGQARTQVLLPVSFVPLTGGGEAGRN